MVAAKYGNADKDLTSRVGKKAKTKEIADKPLDGPGTDVVLSAKVGGVSNRTGPKKSDKKRGG